MATPHLQQLQQLARQLDYETSILEQSPERPFDTLSIVMDYDGSDGSQKLELLYYPENADLEGSDFLQFYHQYAFEYSNEGLQNIRQILPDINNRMSLGHFSISHNEQKLQFKYVLALPLKTKMEALCFKDVLEICMYTPPLFHGIVHEVGVGRLSAEAALRDINPV